MSSNANSSKAVEYLAYGVVAIVAIFLVVAYIF